MNKGLTGFYVELLEKGDVNHPLDFYAFLFDTIYRTSLTEKIAAETKGKPFHLSPEKICSLFSKRTRKEFGRFFRLVLETWTVRSSADVGRAVLKMAEYKCLTLSGTETLEDFEKAGLDI